MGKPSIFISYSQHDERLKNRLLDQLRVLERSGNVHVWSDNRIRAGAPWLDEIDQAMRAASAAILLVTSKFLISDFIQDNEVPFLLERHRVAGLPIFPVIARDCPWRRVDWLAAMQVRPRSGKPVWRDGGRYVDQELAAIADELASILQKRSNLTPAAAPPRKHGRDHATSPVAAWAETRIVEEAVSDAVSALKTTSQGGRPTLAAVATCISTAISYGAPLYNDGHRVLCAAIYLRVARALETSLTAGGQENPQSAMPARGLMPLPAPPTPTVEPSPVHEFVRNEMREVVRVDLSLTSGNADEVAWRLRFAFDHVLQVIDTVKALDLLVAGSSSCGGAVTGAPMRIVEHVLHHTIAIYEDGLSRGQDWIRGVIALQAEGVRMIETILDREPMGGREALSRLRTRLQHAANAASERPYEVAWVLHHNLACLPGVMQRSSIG